MERPFTPGILKNRVARPVDARDANPLALSFGKLRHRHLSVVVSCFADQLTQAFVAAYDRD